MSAYQFGSNDKVSELSVNDFEQNDGSLKKFNDGFCTIMFYANWCGHCIVAKPIYAEISKLACCQVATAAVNCTEDKSVSTLLEKSSSGVSIKGYPTFLQYKNGKYLREYEASGSDRKSLLRFVMGVQNYKY